MSPDSQQSNALSKANRRRSIHALAMKAGLGEHDQFQPGQKSDDNGNDNKKEDNSSLPTSVSRTPIRIPLTARSPSFMKKFKKDSFFNLIKLPTKPDKERGGKKGFNQRARSFAPQPAPTLPGAKKNDDENRETQHKPMIKRLSTDPGLSRGQA